MIRLLPLALIGALCLAACGDDAPPPGVGDGGVTFDGGASLDVPLRLDAPSTDATDSVDGCVSECGERECGDDGCGGECGSCAGVCDEGVCQAAGACPPTGPFGTNVGDVAADAMLEDCEGNPVSLHSLCGDAPSWLYRFSEWCPPCQTFARTEAADLFASYEEQGVSAVLVIAQNRDYNIATQTDCARIRDDLGLPFQVLMDPRNELTGALGIRVNAEAVVFDSNMQILYSKQYDHSGIASTVGGAL